jgi:hypothetical protein
MTTAGAQKKYGRTTENRHCCHPNCKLMAVINGNCRLHYIAKLSTTRRRNRIKAENRLNQYVDKMARLYPTDYLKKIKEGLEDEEKFKQTVREVDLENDLDPETEREFLERLERAVKKSD